MLDVVDGRDTIPEGIYNSPKTNYIDFLEGYESIEKYGNRIKVIEWTEFRQTKSFQQFNPDVVFKLAINYLTEIEENWNPITNGQL